MAGPPRSRSSGWWRPSSAWRPYRVRPTLPTHWPWRCAISVPRGCALPSPPRRERRRDRVAAGLAAGAHRRGRGAARRARRGVPGDRSPAGSGDREHAIVLYGFPTLGERRTFEALLGAHGVGPALALSVLSTLGPDTLVQAVAEDDVDALCAVPGVGRKTAARLVLELKAKLQVPDVAGSPVGTGAGGAVHGDVRAALSELGYGPDEIRRALEAVPGDGRVEDVLRQALRTLAGAR